MVPPLLYKGTLGAWRERFVKRFGKRSGEHSTALVSVLFVSFGVGTIWGKGGIPKVVLPLLQKGTLGPIPGLFGKHSTALVNVVFLL